MRLCRYFGCSLLGRTSQNGRLQICALVRNQELSWGHWQHPANGGPRGHRVAKRPCSPFHARRAPRHRAQRGQRVGMSKGARRCSWSSCWRWGTGSHCWQAVPCASKPRRYCIQGVCIRRVPPSRSMDIDRVTRPARHTGFGQPALLRLAPFCSRYWLNGGEMLHKVYKLYKLHILPI